MVAVAERHRRQRAEQSATPSTLDRQEPLLLPQQRQAAAQISLALEPLAAVPVAAYQLPTHLSLDLSRGLRGGS
jgi:hypothetical protein